MVAPQPEVQIRRYLGRSVHSIAGPMLGRVEDVLADVRSHHPQWLLLRMTGLRRGCRAIPLAIVLETDQRLIAPVARGTLREAPGVSLRADLTAQDELELRRYWMDH